MQKLTTTKVFKSDKNKDGQEFKTKDGKKFWKVAVKFQEYGDEWYSCLAFKEDDRVMQMNEGEEYLVVIEESNGFKNFKLPSRLDVMQAQIDELNVRLRKLEQPSKVPGTDIEYPDEINPDDIPF